MKIQLKRSNVLDGGSAKSPSTAQMEYGELAVNYNTQDPTLFIKDSANTIVRLFDTTDIDDKLNELEISINDINSTISILPSPIDGVTFQPGTLDVRYISRFSWDNLPLLS